VGEFPLSFPRPLRERIKVRGAFIIHPHPRPLPSREREAGIKDVGED